MIFSTATVPVNPEGEARLTREQAWKGSKRSRAPLADGML